MIKTNSSPKSKRLEQLTFIGGTAKFQSNLTQKTRLDFPNTMLLSSVQENDWVAILEIGTDRDTCIYLNQLGLKSKTSVQIVSHTASGSVVVNLGKKQIGLGSEITQKVLVTLASEKK